MENQGLEHDVWRDLDLGFGVHNFGCYGSRSGGDSVACFVGVEECHVVVIFFSFLPAVEVGWESTRLGRGLGSGVSVGGSCVGGGFGRGFRGSGGGG